MSGNVGFYVMIFVVWWAQRDILYDPDVVHVCTRLFREQGLGPSKR
jgi:hypothetical protein